ncbi:MAG: hypothetical protein V7687_05400 [Maribacter arcticus]|uniref:hypothetical protein n=1 Tax=Maribacter arcticus TaxID=561365 RepID=UPI0030038FC0
MLKIKIGKSLKVILLMSIMTLTKSSKRFMLISLKKKIRLAAFLRMNLTTKEIAATLNVLPDSILKSKYRLKKKLNLDKNTYLTTFLNTL